MSDSRMVAEEARMIKRLKTSCWEEWQRGRAKTQIPSFNSKSAKSKVMEFVDQAIRTSDEMDVLQAVHELSRDPDGFPWDIPKRAMHIGGNRRELMRLERKLLEREGAKHIGAIIREAAKGGSDGVHEP